MQAPPIVRVAAGADCFGEARGLGVSAIQFKVAGQGSDGRCVRLAASNSPIWTTHSPPPRRSLLK